MTTDLVASLQILNVMQMWYPCHFVQDTGHLKTSTAVKFKSIFQSKMCCKTFVLQDFLSFPAILQLIGVCFSMALFCSNLNPSIGLSDLQNKWTCTLPRHSNQSHQMLEGHVDMHADICNQLMKQNPSTGYVTQGEVTKWKWYACGKEAFKLILWLSSLIDH